MIERFVEGLADFGRQRPQFGGVAVAAEQFGALGDGDRFAIAVSSRSDLRIDDPRTVVMAPVAEAEFNDAVVRQRFEETDVLPHLPVIPFDDRSVAGVEVDVVGDQDECAVPDRAGTPVEAPAAGGNDAGQLSVRALHVGDGLNPLRIGRREVEIEEPGFGGERCVAGPAVFFAVRTVGRNSDEVPDEAAAGVFEEGGQLAVR